MDHILDYTICNIFEIPSFFISKEYLTNCIKIKDCFGIFVTIKRSQEYKLQDFPYDIHGCIGKFNYPFNILKNETILDSIISCAKSAAYDDGRREYFKNPLFLDSSATLEVSFLVLPSYDIDASTGMITEISTQYNNDDFGIIAIGDDDNKTATATFLPKVFDINTPWDEIKTRLLEKGNIKTAYFKTYSVHKYSKKIFDIINENYISKLFTNISSFFNKNYKDNIPYAIIKSDDNSSYNIIYNNDEDVRNIATLNDLMVIENNIHVLSIDVLKNIQRDVDKYINKYNNEIIIRQSLAFLTLVNKNKDISLNICKSLLLKINDMEKDFELGQALIAIVNCNHNSESNDIIKNTLINMMVDLANRESYSLNDIFRINWQTKALFAYYMKNKDDNHIVEHFNFLITLIINIISKNINSIIELETNYLAVFFECMSTIHKYDSNINILNNYLYFIFILLQKRFSVFGLYMFNDHSARIDITGHCVQGFVQYLL
jgi:hypothetical protein